MIKLVHPNGVEFKWTPNEEEDLEGTRFTTVEKKMVHLKIVLI